MAQMAVASDATNGPLITMVTTTGVVYGKQGTLSAPWIKEYSGVARVAVASDGTNGPLIAVRLSILTRKTLGGLATDLSGRVLRADGGPLPGLYAAGEATGFGGGGMHGYRSLEGTFLGGCIFSGRIAGRAAAKEVGS